MKVEPANGLAAGGWLINFSVQCWTSLSSDGGHDKKTNSIFKAINLIECSSRKTVNVATVRMMMMGNKIIIEK